MRGNNKLKTSFLLVFAIAGLGFQIPNSYACSCAAPIDYFQALSEADFAFTGTVRQIDDSDGPQKVYFDVGWVAKGDITNGTFVLENNNLIRNGEFTTHSSCDVGYTVGVTYDVMVYDNINMNNGLCTTKPVGFLGILNPFEYTVFYYVIFATALAAIAIFVIWRKRK